MAEVYYPHPDHGDPAGRVTEKEYAEGIGFYQSSGLFGHPTNPDPVFIAGGQCYVRMGIVARMLGMAYTIVDEDLPVSIASNGAGSTRLDNVVLRLTWSDMEIHAAVKQGTAGNPMPTVTRQRGTGVFEHPLAQVSVPAGGTVATATVTPTSWYIGSDGQYRANPSTRPPNEAGRIAWEHETGRLVAGTGSQWWVIGDNATTQLALATSNWSAPQYNRIQKRNGWAIFAVSPQRVSGNFAAGVTSTLGTIPTGFRPAFEIESTGFAPSSSADVVVRLAANGVVTMSFFNGGLNTNRFVNLPAITYPVSY